jgi:hypothetical protein
MSAVKTLLLTACALVLSACASSGANIRSDSVPGLDFTQFKTWGFLEPISAQQRGVSQLTVQQVQNAVRTQMERRGFVYADENPNLVVNFDMATRATPPAAPRTRVGVSYGVSSGGGSGVGIGLSTGLFRKRPVREGTLTIDVVDRAQNQMIWTGTIEGKVPNDQPTSTFVDTAVGQVFDRFPVNAR